MLEWDAASSARFSASRLSLSDELDDGFTKVQGSKAKRQNQVNTAPSTKIPVHATATGRGGRLNGYDSTNNQGTLLTNGHTYVRGRPEASRPERGRPDRGRGRGAGRGNENDNHFTKRSTNPAPPPDRSTTQRSKPKSAAELACQRGEPAAGERVNLFIRRDSCLTSRAR